MNVFNTSSSNPAFWKRYFRRCIYLNGEESASTKWPFSLDWILTEARIPSQVVSPYREPSQLNSHRKRSVRTVQSWSVWRKDGSSALGTYWYEIFEKPANRNFPKPVGASACTIKIPALFSFLRRYHLTPGADQRTLRLSTIFCDVHFTQGHCYYM